MNPSETILYLLKENEQEAFRLIFARYYDNLLLYCYRILDDLEAAEDIVQDSFMTLWNTKRLNSFTGNLDHFIFKIVKNQALLFLREHKKRYDLQTSFFRENETEEDQEESPEKIELLYHIIEQLPEKCRKIFLMACLNDKSYQEIADELNISINTVKTQMKTALRFLRENLRDESYFAILFFFIKKD